MAKKEATPADAGAPSGGKSKLKLILLIVVGLLLAIGLSVGGTWFFLSKSLKAEKTEEVASSRPTTISRISFSLLLPPLGAPASAGVASFLAMPKIRRYSVK